VQSTEVNITHNIWVL